MQYAERIRTKLTATLTPHRLQIDDVSHHHAGHGGHDLRGESHFNVLIVADGFSGLSRVARQRLVYDLLRVELTERIHALSLQTLTPEEAARRPEMTASA